MLTLLIGGARRGKTSFAESLCSNEARVSCLATARVEEKEMAERVQRHRQDRPAYWTAIQESLVIEVALCRALEICHVVLPDCLTVWFSNLLYHHRRRPVLEAGAGFVPTTKIARAFSDLQRRVNQRMAAAADQVYFLTAAIPMQTEPSRFV